MAYAIRKDFIPGLPQVPYRNGIGAYEGVVAHATASYAGDENQVEYSKNNWRTREAFVQYWVDWDSITQTADDAYKAWGAGPTANKRYVHVELCQTKDRALFLESYKRYVWLLAFILRKKNLGVKDGVTLVSHNFCSVTFGDTNHTDPVGYLAEHGKTWADVVKDVTAEYAAMANPLPPNQEADGAQSYTVKAGDSLSLIALKFKVTVEELAAANNIKDLSLIYVGQKLVIPVRDERVEAIKALVAAGVISSPEYWVENAKAGRTVDGGYAAQLIANMAEFLKGV